MELQRKDYPALLTSLPPTQAIHLLNDRMRHVGQLNSSIADWLQERCRIEEQYVQGLRKLAHRHPPDESSDLGIFSMPWQKIINATEAAAESHHQLAQKIEVDVERPLREFAATNREVQAMGTISGNLSSMAKDIETSKKKAEKLRDKGTKAQASKVANALADVEAATLQWESQAPYVFEKLQAVDESRLNHLRDVLTQFQTHEVDQVERNRVMAEETLNVLLNVETADEIKTFVLRAQSGDAPQPVTRKTSVASTPARSLPPPTPIPPIPPIPADDDRSQKSGSVHEEPKSGGLRGLKRFGTVLSRRRQSTHPYGRASSPDRKSSTNLGTAFGGFGKGKSKERDTSSPAFGRPASPLRKLSTPRASDASVSPKQTRKGGSDWQNGTTSPDPDHEVAPGSSILNGIAQETIPELKEPHSPNPTPAEPVKEPQKDADGFTVRPSAVDAITEAEREAGVGSSELNGPPQFKLDIRNAPIQEEDGDADAALASLANTLRAQAIPPPRRSNTLRGRRDVRNTIFVPNPATPELTRMGESIPPLPSSAPDSSSVSFPSTFSPPALAPQPTSPPFKVSHRGLLSDDHPSSDTQSVMSGRSLASASSTTVRHPELHGPGLNASLVETVSTWFEQGKATKAIVRGQIALAFNPIDITAGPFGTETIRLDNFPVLEKVAPDLAFIRPVADSPGEFTVDLSKVLRTTLALHYQLHVDERNVSSFGPILLAPVWKSEASQTSVLLHYSLNPQFPLGEATSLTLRNLILVLRLEPGVRTTSCQSKPTGTFSRDKSLIYWRLGDVVLAKDAPAQTLRARFFTDGEARPGNAEARWEISGAQAIGLGSQLGVSMQVALEKKESTTAQDDVFAADPFADGDEAAASTGGLTPVPVLGWRGVESVKRIVSGTYLGV